MCFLCIPTVGLGMLTQIHLCFFLTCMQQEQIHQLQLCQFSQIVCSIFTAGNYSCSQRHSQENSRRSFGRALEKLHTPYVGDVQVKGTQGSEGLGSAILATLFQISHLDYSKAWKQLQVHLSGLISLLFPCYLLPFQALFKYKLWTPL